MSNKEKKSIKEKFNSLVKRANKVAERQLIHENVTQLPIYTIEDLNLNLSLRRKMNNLTY